MGRSLRIVTTAFRSNTILTRAFIYFPFSGITAQITFAASSATNI